MLFLILTFHPNWPFCQGTMTDFQNSLIFRIFGVFSSGFLHRTTLMWLKNRFLHVFLNFNFWPKLTTLPKHDDRFSKSSHFSNIWCFLKQFFAQNNSNVIKDSFFACFCEFFFLTQTDHFARAGWPIFKIVSFLEYLVFSQAVFCEEQL